MTSYRLRLINVRDSLLVRLIAPTYLLVAVAYLYWRTSVVNWHVWYGPVAWMVELYAIGTGALFVFTLWRVDRPVPHQTEHPNRTVDILIPTLNEPLTVLEPTVLGATRVRGVRRVIVLDDGQRPEVAEMAARHGADYIARTEHSGAKAGNLNNGLSQSDADLIVTLDADHIALPDLIEATVGYFDDPWVGFVQSPQSFYNTDSFTFRRRRFGRSGWQQQDMFYKAIEPARNHTNSVIYTGTSAMIRRAALLEVGGFATGTATEDLHTSLRLHALGWRGVFVPTPLAYGLEVENLEEYYGSRKRWAAGSLRLLFRHPDSPLRIKGLTLSQRLSYLGATITHLQGVNRMLYLLTPIATLLIGISPVRGHFGFYGFVFLGFGLFSMATVNRLSRGHHHLLHTEAFTVADTIPMLAALIGLVTSSARFRVSRKRTTRSTSARVTTAYRAYGALTLAVLALAGYRLVAGGNAAVAGWSIVFVGLGAFYVVPFLIGMARYEHQTTTPWYVRFTPEGLYQQVVYRFGRPERTALTSHEDTMAPQVPASGTRRIRSIQERVAALQASGSTQERGAAVADRSHALTG